MKKIFLLSFLFISINTFGNNNDSIAIAELQKQVKQQEHIIGNLRKEIRSAKSVQKELSTNIDSLQKELVNTQSELSSLSEKLGIDITKAQKQITDNAKSLGDNIKSKTVWGVSIAILIVTLLVAAYLILYKRMQKGKSAIDKIKDSQEELQKVQKELAKESAKMDEKLIELLNKQLNMQTIAMSSIDNKKDMDHSLALKISNELVKIETVLSKMDNTIKGHSHLLKAVEHVKNNLKANGYEIINLIGQDYNEGMPFNARFIPDETLPEGKRVISGINKYQINYNGKMIQAADIVVRQNI